MPIRFVVHSADFQDRDGAALVFDKIKLRFPWLSCVFADTGYNAQQAYKAAGVNGLRLEVIEQQWVVEQTLSWLGRNWRLAKDFENLASTLLALSRWPLSRGSRVGKGVSRSLSKVMNPSIADRNFSDE